MCREKEGLCLDCEGIILWREMWNSCVETRNRSVDEEEWLCKESEWLRGVVLWTEEEWLCGEKEWWCEVRGKDVTKDDC